MEYKLEEKNGCLVQYTFKIAWEEIKSDYEEALVEVAKEAEIPGFRKGKAPMELVKAKYKNPIEGELKSRLLQKVATFVVEKENLKLFSDPGADNLNFKEEMDFSGKLYFEVYPDVPEIQCDDIEITIFKKDVSEEDVQKIADGYRMKFAEIKTMDNEIIEEGDFCSVKISNEDGSSEEDVLLKCSAQSFDEVEKFLLGKKCGENYELEIGENQKRHKGKYKISVLNVVRRVLPVLDDELAVKSGFSSLGELMEKSKEKAIFESSLKQKEERNRAIVRELLEKYKFDIPQTLLERQIEEDAQRFAIELKKYNQDTNNFDWEKYFEIRRIPVENNIRAFFIVSKIIEQEKIEIKDEDVNDFLKNIAENEGISVSKLREIIEKSEQMNDIKFKIAEEKALENISNCVKIKHVETPEKDKGGSDVDSNSG